MALPRPGGPSFYPAQVSWPASSSSLSRASPQPTRRCPAQVDSAPRPQPFDDAQFDIFEWHPYFLSCMRYFLDHAQYDGPIQALAAFVNFKLPFQKAVPVLSSRSLNGASSRGQAAPGGGCVSLQPYIRRLVATGFDFPSVLHGFFGDDWAAGIGHLHEQERRNYLFAAKSDSWLGVKTAYDMGDDQAVPFLRPLQAVQEKEIVAAEASWSEWLAMQDWMLGPRSVEMAGENRSVAVKREDE